MMIPIGRGQFMYLPEEDTTTNASNGQVDLTFAIVCIVIVIVSCLIAVGVAVYCLFGGKNGQ